MKKLTEKERAVYEWQLDVPGFGELGQEKLKNASVLVSRCGGLGSVVAYEKEVAVLQQFSIVVMSSMLQLPKSPTLLTPPNAMSCIAI